MVATKSCTVDVFNAHRRYRIGRKVIEGYVQRVVGKRKALISVVCVDSHRLKSINKTFLNHNYVTDVISFRLEEKPALEGEVYVNLDRAKQQAQDYAVSFHEEVARLVIHGTLHLIGYDDVSKLDAAKMKVQEDRHVRFWFAD